MKIRTSLFALATVLLACGMNINAADESPKPNTLPGSGETSRLETTTSRQDHRGLVNALTGAVAGTRRAGSRARGGKPH